MSYTTEDKGSFVRLSKKEPTGVKGSRTVSLDIDKADLAQVLALLSAADLAYSREGR